VKQTKLILNIAVWLLLPFFVCTLNSGCGKGGLESYRNEWIYPEDITTVYVEMFDTSSFRRGYEYILTDAICKRLEAQTPYKIVSDMDQADTVLSGQLGSIGSHVLATDRFSGTPLERETNVIVSVRWKNLKTGELLLNNERAHAFASYSTQLGQDFDYSAKVALNRVAEKVVELMEESW
jgi:hypothetical protein